MIIGLCFDIGGTLVNSGPGFCEQVISIVGTSRPNLKALLQRHFLCSSVSRTLAIRHFCEALKVDSPSTLETEIRKIKKKKSYLFHDVLPTFQKLDCYRMAVLSNATPWDISDLNHLGISSFIESAVYSFEIGVNKPDSRAFRAVEQRLGLGPEHLVMVGDSLTADVIGAKKVGWKAIYLQREKSSIDGLAMEADAVISSLAELPKVLIQF